MKYLCLVFVLIFLTLHLKSNAQNAKIKGTVVDETFQKPLYRVSVVLLQAKDSFMVANMRTDSAGKFSFKDLRDTAKYILLFSYPKYADYSHFVDMRKVVKGILYMKDVRMILKGKLLKEVLIKSSTSSIKIKGDTTEYFADDFKVQPNATVEDLLKQLPGLQVDQYGNITAQGQRVKKVLVDGEEFFSDDPTLVTRNLRADMISTVQVYDKKSDAAAFTGIEDGVKEKTINLKLKKDKKHGLFGKAEVGGGSDHHYLGQGMLNAFKDKRKMAIYGTTSNIGRLGLGSADKKRVGDNSGDNSNYKGAGVPKSFGTGAHYNNSWREGKESINSNYKYNTVNIRGSQSTVSQNNLPTGFIRGEANKSFVNHSLSNRANAKYIHKFDTTSTFTVYANGYKGDTKLSSQGSGEVRRNNNSRINNKEYTTQSDYGIYVYNLNLSWKKKLGKDKRTISFYLNNNFNHDRSSGTDRSESRFYDINNIQDSIASLDLARQTNDNWRTNTFKAIYTEPVSRKLSLLINYKLRNSEVDDDKTSYNLAVSSNKDYIDSLFSTKIHESIWSNQMGAALNYALKKIIIKVGNNINFSTYSFTKFYQPLSLRRHFVNWNPTASFSYNPTQLQRFYFAYTGNSINPGRNQLLPYRYSNDQLTTYLPNTNLKKSFNHTINSNYRQVKGIGQIYMGGNLKLRLTANPIILSSKVAPNGAYTYRYENLNDKDNSSYNANIYYGRYLKGWKLQSSLGINGGIMYSKINTVLSKLNYSTYALRLYMAKEKPKKYGISLLISGGYTNNRYSPQTTTKNNYFFYAVNPSVAIYFLRKMEFHTDCNYFWQQKTQTFEDNFDRLIWNAWLGYKMLKNDQLTIKVSCNDILNQNNGYSRTANNTLFTEKRYTTIRRFFMIGVTWSFTKFNSLKQ